MGAGGRDDTAEGGVVDVLDGVELALGGTEGEAGGVGEVEDFGADLDRVAFADGDGFEKGEVVVAERRAVELATLQAAEGAGLGVREDLTGEEAGTVRGDAAAVRTEGRRGDEVGAVAGLVKADELAELGTVEGRIDGPEGWRGRRGSGRGHQFEP